MPVTPARSADVARALAIVRPESRRRLYWTMRSVLVTDPAEVRIFDRAFREVFGDGRPDDAVRARRAARDGRRGATSGRRWRRPARPTAPRRTQGTCAASAPSDGDDDRPPRSTSRWRWRATRSGWPSAASTASSPHELAQLYRADVAPAAGHARSGARAAYERARHGRRIDLRRTLRTQPAHRRRPDPAGAPAAARRAAAARDAVRHLRLDGAVRPGLPAVPDLRRGRRAERRGVRVRHAADAADARAGRRATPSGRSSGRRRRRPTGRAARGSATR